MYYVQGVVNVLFDPFSNDQDKITEDDHITTASGSSNIESERKLEPEVDTMFPTLAESKLLKYSHKSRKSSSNNNTTSFSVTSKADNPSTLTLGAFIIGKQHHEAHLGGESKSSEPNGHSRSVYQPSRSRDSINSTHPTLTRTAVGILDKAQKLKLQTLLDEKFEISSKDRRLSFFISMNTLLSRLQHCLEQRGIPMCTGGIRLVGSGASYVVSDTTERELNDLDFSFYINEGGRFLDILELEEEVLCVLLHEHLGVVQTKREVYDNFFLDSVKVESQSGGPVQESWSLITIGKKGSQTIDVKFIFKSKRSYVFSADSFEVILDPLFPSNTSSHTTNGGFTSYRTKTISVEALYGDYQTALRHLNNNLIAAVNPEEIRSQRVGVYAHFYLDAAYLDTATSLRKAKHHGPKSTVSS